MPNKNNNAATSKVVEENITAVADEETTTDTSNNKEVIDVDWSEVEQIFNTREQLREMEMHLARQCVQFEKSKHEILQRIAYIENAVFEMATELRENKNIDDSLTYELKLPSSPQEKAYFLLRE